ncbi:hypothetical protein SMD44_p10190 (plasmid) [Streptomyces alboflavus]|uniref:ATP/GTP-binding protein n=1 Tax=Streptomyces alboflavus TaxID=67267 RepID=A0A291W539_9ACTN|nr:hypothetical protein [Streptomyces alboflavus]ATM24689.1 hypothetical protein SMD44_p10190 [Streptomyces alboflavus]
MLSPRGRGGVLAAAALAVPLHLGLSAGPAAADGDRPGGGVTCPELVPDCDINAHGGGGGGDKPDKPRPGAKPSRGGGGGGGSAKCFIKWDNIGEVPCYKPDMGWFNQSNQCYWEIMKPQPGKDAADWEWGTAAPSSAADRAKGKVYNVTCPGAGRELMGGSTWSLNPPPGFGGGGPSPEELAQEAIKKMRLLGADIGTAPKAGKTGLVGMPVWIWNNKTPRTWGPVTASASAPGITVTATATVKKIAYTMGDGGTEVCTTAGTPYRKRFGGQPSPDCGYRYTKTSSSQPGEAFTVTAVTTWTVHWAGGGQEGDITTTRQAEPAQITVGEAQAVAKP